MESLGINYQQAKELVEKYISDPVTKLHSRESEIFIRALAKHFGENEEQWGVIGLLHDIDWDLIKKADIQKHCIKSDEILREADASDFLINTVASHGWENEYIPELQGKKRLTKIQYCLAAAETLTGLIFASALVQPDKKIESVSLQSLKKKFKNKGFAAKCNRETIIECEKAGIPIDAFLQIGLNSMQDIAQELGL